MRTSSDVGSSGVNRFDARRARMVASSAMTREYGPISCIFEVEGELAEGEPRVRDGGVEVLADLMASEDPRGEPWNSSRLTLSTPHGLVRLTLEESQALRADLEAAELDVARASPGLVPMPLYEQATSRGVCAQCHGRVERGEIVMAGSSLVVHAGGCTTRAGRRR